MGIVYRAIQKDLGRPVAIKLPTITSVEDAARFVREGRILAGLEHPNIVRVYDAGNEDGQLYIVLEFILGHTLTDLAGGQPLPVAESVAILQQVLAGLEAAHSHGVLHRDIKSDNILVTADGVVKLVDFGLARAETDRTLTRSGTVMGTPAYMAPEVIQGRPADARADVYAATIVLYELLAGQTPFDAPETTALLAKHLREEPPASPLGRTGVPASLQAAIMRGLAKDPARRWPSANALAQAIAQGAGVAPARSGQRTVLHRADRGTKLSVAGATVTIDRKSLRQVDSRPPVPIVATRSRPSHTIRATRPSTAVRTPTAVTARPSGSRWMAIAAGVTLVLGGTLWIARIAHHGGSRIAAVSPTDASPAVGPASEESAHPESIEIRAINVSDSAAHVYLSRDASQDTLLTVVRNGPARRSHKRPTTPPVESRKVMVSKGASDTLVSGLSPDTVYHCEFTPAAPGRPTTWSTLGRPDDQPGQSTLSPSPAEFDVLDIAARQQTVAAAWVAVKNNLWEIRVRTSDDGGLTWTPPTTVHVTPLEVRAMSIAMGPGLWVAWREGAFGDGKLRVSRRSAPEDRWLPAQDVPGTSAEALSALVHCGDDKLAMMLSNPAKSLGTSIPQSGARPVVLGSDAATRGLDLFPAPDDADQTDTAIAWDGGSGVALATFYRAKERCSQSLRVAWLARSDSARQLRPTPCPPITGILRWPVLALGGGRLVIAYEQCSDLSGTDEHKVVTRTGRAGDCSLGEPGDVSPSAGRSFERGPGLIWARDRFYIAFASSKGHVENFEQANMSAEEANSWLLPSQVEVYSSSDAASWTLVGRANLGAPIKTISQIRLAASQTHLLVMLSGGIASDVRVIALPLGNKR